MARKKSSFYHTRWNRCGLNEARAAEVIGCTVEDVQRFDDEGVPIAEHLLLLWDSKHVNHDGWDGFLFSRGVLRFKNRRWTPAMLKAWQRGPRRRAGKAQNRKFAAEILAWFIHKFCG